MSITDFSNSPSSDINHYFMKFFCFLYLSLHYYILFPSQNILFYLISPIILPNSLGNYKCPLSVAIEQNSMEIVKLLVERGANVNMKLILFLFIFIIVLYCSLEFQIYH